MKTRKLKAMSKNKIILLVLSFLMTSIWNTYAQVATVSGVVQDKSGETDDYRCKRTSERNG